jgi:hypothetical protein
MFNVIVKGVSIAVEVGTVVAVSGRYMSVSSTVLNHKAIAGKRALTGVAPPLRHGGQPLCLLGTSGQG